MVAQHVDPALIDNPIRSIEPAELEARARAFAIENGLKSSQTLFVKAAHVAKDPESFRTVQGVTEEEIEALANEKKLGFWKQKKELRITIVTMCLAAVIQGWSQTGINGANQNWPAEFKLEYGFSSSKSTHDTWIFAVVNAATYLSASIVGCWLSDPMNEYLFGRRAAIFLSGLFSLAALIGSAFVNNWKQLLATRVILGIGMGAKASVAPIYAAEVAPSHIRGSLVMNWQLFDTFGIFLGFTANLIAKPSGRHAWRYQHASAAIPVVCLLTLVWACPESPRFLIKKGRYRNAFKSLSYLTATPLQAARELFYVDAQIRVEERLFARRAHASNHRAEMIQVQGNTAPIEPSHGRDMSPSRGYSDSPIYLLAWMRRFADLFRVPRIRRATVAAFTIMIAQQLCGMNILMFFSSTLLRSADTESDYPALWLSWGFGLSNFLFSFPAYLILDTRGRRFPVLLATPFMFLTMLIAGLGYKIQDHGAREPFVAVFFFCFIFFYSWSLGPVPFTYSSEVFPLVNREVGMSFAVFWNLFGAGLLALFHPFLQLKLGRTKSFSLFAGFNVLQGLMVFLLVPETAGAALGTTADNNVKNVSLEELTYIFMVKTRDHIQYQVRHVVPWAFDYYIRRDRNVRKFRPKPDPLYVWAEDRQQSA